MIITIKGADFSTKNIGTLSTWTILTNLGSGATYSGNRLVDKGSRLLATITIADGYELGSAGVSVIMGTTDITSSAATVSGNTIIINITTVTGNVTINVPTINTGGEEIPNYTFTINPTPSNATVTLTASGYTQNGNSIIVPNGTTVSWSVSASGYTEQTGTWTANGSNKTENVVLSATGGDILSGITMVQGNAFLATPGTTADRASSIINFRAEGWTRVELKDPIKYDYACYDCIDEMTQSGGVGTGWIETQLTYTNKWVGVCLRKKDGSDFDFSTESNLLSDYITVTK